ncbi:MAG TPA: hypothetical protein VFA28_01275 [Bryobacteraceae bacterium]|nr:hypothetical protein [Bryobacteraceae bacterium]
MAATDIKAEEQQAIEAYSKSVREAFARDFDTADRRFDDGEKLLRRFHNAIATLLEKGRRYISSVDEAHNELCVASQLLLNENPRFALEYEPALPGCAKTIDFRAVSDKGDTFYVDVKTIKPKPLDRWREYMLACERGWFPQNVRVTLSEEYLGGELWHMMVAARSRMLEYALELEAKIRDCELSGDNTFFILALCGNGFRWEEDELEDFVWFYRRGSHRDDDPFSTMEAYHVDKKSITIDRTINQFACLIRPQFEVRHQQLNWNVQPPRAV